MLTQPLYIWYGLVEDGLEGFSVLVPHTEVAVVAFLGQRLVGYLRLEELKKGAFWEPNIQNRNKRREREKFMFTC